MAFEIKANDRLPSLEADLTFEDGTVPSLAGTTVDFILAAITSVSDEGVPSFALLPAVDAPAQVVSAGDPGAVPPVPPRVRYDWAAGDTAVTPGQYAGEFQVTHADGRAQTFPTNGWLEVTVYPDLNRGL